MLPATNTQDFLIQTIISEVVNKLMQEKGLNFIEAFGELASSTFLDKIENVKTGLYLEGSDYIYELLKEELNDSPK